jgi:serine/threonine protein kinase
MLLNNGKHPFYVKGESIKDFNKKIQNCKINFYNKISPMAQHLLFKLLEPNPSWRYNAAQALKHPWITRNKNDEVPLTFNEILHKSNMKKVGKELFGAMLFINYFTKKKKFLINNKYIQTCKFYDKKAKNKNIRRKEKCLDILTTSEGDDSENELPNEKKNFAKIKLSEKKSDLVNSVQNSFVISANNIIHKIIKKKKMNFAESMKNVKRLNRINHTDKKLPFNFKKMDYQLNLFSTRKRADSLKKNNNENNNNTFRTHLIKICIKSQNEKTNEILKRNSYKSIQNENNKELNYSKSLRIINNSKKPRINNYYEERIKNKKQLPDINSQLKKNDISSKQYSLNDSENYNIIPLVLPNIKLLKRANYLRKSIKKVVIRNKGNKIKNS